MVPVTVFSGVLSLDGYYFQVDTPSNFTEPPDRTPGRKYCKKDTPWSVLRLIKFLTIDVVLSKDPIPGVYYY